MSDKAAKMIMYGLIAIAGSMFFQVLFNPSPKINRYQTRSIEHRLLFDSKTGTLYHRGDDHKWHIGAELEDE